MLKAKIIRSLSVGAVASLVFAGLLPPDTPIPEAGQLGSPHRPLDATEQEQFLLGRGLFDRDFGHNEGVGPHFNGDSCRSCHQDPVIGGGGVTTAMIGAGNLSLTGGPWISGSARITNIQTNVISLPNRSGGVTGIAFTLDPRFSEEVKTLTTMGSFLTSSPNGLVSTRSTVRVQGSNGLVPTASGAQGTLQLIVPARVNLAPIAGSKPALATMTLVFVPEPGVFSLLGAGAVFLVLLGRRRARR